MEEFIIWVVCEEQSEVFSKAQYKHKIKAETKREAKLIAKKKHIGENIVLVYEAYE